MDALYIISTQRLEYYHLTIILRSLLKYESLTIVVLGLASSLAERLTRKLYEIFSKLSLQERKPVILYYDGKLENPENLLEFVKTETGKRPNVLVSETPEIYQKFYGLILIDHLDGVKNEVEKLLEE
jgi:hypothetical protein